MAISLARLPPPPACLSASHWRSAASAATLGTAGSGVRSVRSAAPFERENREMIRSLFGLQLRRKLGLADHRKFVRQSVIYCTKIGKINQPNIGLYVQGGPTGRGTLFFDIYLKVQPQYKVHIQICNSNFNVTKRLSSARWGPLYLANSQFTCIARSPPPSRFPIYT